jgi:thiamine kinase-like enzyme
MSKEANNEIIRSNLRGHPAVSAWSNLLPRRVDPAWIEVLHEGKSLVYRLEGVGTRGASVIAKRCRVTTVERKIYEEVLPQLPLTALHYYGFTAEDDKFGWLFLEDAGSAEYSASIEAHRALAAQWLGRMHTSAAHVVTGDRLPDRGPGHYLKRLQSGAKTLRNASNPELKADDLAVLESIVSKCEFLESRWHQVEELCAGFPQTLVHGDFTAKNLRVQPGRAGIALLPFDWELASWGVPAADLAQSARLGKGVHPTRKGAFSAHPDLVSYWVVVRDHWPSVDLQTIQRVANCGSLFRCLAAINWAAPLLAHKGAEWVVGDLRIYHAELSNAIEAAAWEQ